MEYKFSELVDIQKIHQLTDAFYEATGISTAIITPEGEILSGSGWQDICAHFHRKNPESRKVCVASDTRVRIALMKKKGYMIYQCPHGLIDAAAPIIVDGRHMANCFTGQFLLRKPGEKEKENFEKQARKYDFDKEAYMEALARTPIIPEQRMKPILKYFTLFAEVVGQMGFEQRNLKNEISKRIEAQQKKERLNSALRSMLNISQLIAHEKDQEKLLNGTCGKLIESEAFETAWIALFDDHRRLVTGKQAGMGERFKLLLNRLAHQDPPICFQNAVSQPDALVIENRYEICGGCPLCSNASRTRAFAVRLQHGEKTYGALVAELSERFPLDNEELSLLSGLANDIALAINNIQVQKERDRVEKALALREKELEEKSRSLENINQALKAMLDQRELEKKAIEENMAINLRRFVNPYLDDLERSITKNDSRTYLDIARKNLMELVTPISNTISTKYIDLTPAEIKVADLIRQGKDTKEIALLLNLSSSTVYNFRNNIRRKLGLINRNVNLRTYLGSLIS